MTHYLSDLSAGRDNNFNLIRMVAALAVLYSHAFPITLGPNAVQPLQNILNGVSVGAIAVQGFFGISGFLITRSYVRSGSWVRYWSARTLRLFPALFIALLATVLVAGFFLTTEGPLSFWSAAPEYIIRNLTLFSLKYDLPGVFSDNPYGSPINGSLWTLFHEFVCYTMVFAVGLIGMLNSKRRSTVLIVLYLAFHVLVRYYEPHPRLTALNELSFPFFLGSIAYVYQEKIPLNYWLSACLFALAYASRGWILFPELLSLSIVYGIFVLGYRPSGGIRHYNKLGDYSYGTYIYAFPIQQLIASLGVASVAGNILYAVPITVALAVASWHLLERPALDLARDIGRKVPA
ncbi:MAG: acyltransferase [Pseudomonadota bacterium]